MSENKTAKELLDQLVDLLAPLVQARILGTEKPEDDAANERRYVHVLPPPKELPPDEELRVIRSPEQTIIMPCPHPTAPRGYRFTVHGSTVNMTDAIIQCAECLQRLLDATSEQCAECGRPILMSHHVALAWVDAPHPYTHAQCAPNQMLICGQWGVGVLVRLHELDGDIPEGTVTTEGVFAVKQAEIAAQILKSREAKPPEAAADPAGASEAERAVAAAIAPDPSEAKPDEQPTDPDGSRAKKPRTAN